MTMTMIVIMVVDYAPSPLKPEYYVFCYCCCHRQVVDRPWHVGFVMVSLIMLQKLAG